MMHLMTRDIDHETDRIVEALERLSVETVGVTTLALTRFEPETELTMRQWRALVLIGSRREGVRVGEIASHLGSAGPSASRLVRRLEDRGLVDTRRDESDRRATNVRLTSGGVGLRDTLVVRRRELLRSALAASPLPSDSDVADGLDHITRALADMMSGDVPGSGAGD
jgi:DNA-binding MarR family transcriptional regulator